MNYSYINGISNERFFLIEDYYYKGFGIQIDKKEVTGEFYGKLYNSYEPYRLTKTAIDSDIESLKAILEGHADNLINEE